MMVAGWTDSMAVCEVWTLQCCVVSELAVFATACQAHRLLAAGRSSSCLQQQFAQPRLQLCSRLLLLLPLVPLVLLRLHPQQGPGHLHRGHHWCCRQQPAAFGPCSGSAASTTIRLLLTCNAQHARIESAAELGRRAWLSQALAQAPTLPPYHHADSSCSVAASS